MINLVCSDAYNHSSASMNIPVHGVSAQQMQQSAQHWPVFTFSLNCWSDEVHKFVSAEFLLNLGSVVIVLNAANYQINVYEWKRIKALDIKLNLWNTSCFIHFYTQNELIKPITKIQLPEILILYSSFSTTRFLKQLVFMELLIVLFFVSVRHYFTFNLLEVNFIHLHDPSVRTHKPLCFNDMRVQLTFWCDAVCVYIYLHIVCIIYMKYEYNMFNSFE